MNERDRDSGLYREFAVQRADGSSGPGGKHEDCRYFVLDLDHDSNALPAVDAYAASCAAEYPALAADLIALAADLRAARAADRRAAARPLLQWDVGPLNYPASVNGEYMWRYWVPTVRLPDGAVETRAVYFPAGLPGPGDEALGEFASESEAKAACEAHAAARRAKVKGMGYKNDDECLKRVADDEPIFVLRAQDRSAPFLVELWATLAENSGCGAEKVAEARAHAQRMRDWAAENGSKSPD
jgi:hypothetical protein